MAITYTTTAAASKLHGVKMCAHGRGGVGKTTMIQTLPRPIMISAESGLLALRHLPMPAMVIENFDDMDEAYNYLTLSADARNQFDSVALDSISEIAEQCLTAEKAKSKDGRQAYGEMNDKIGAMIRKFRDLPGWHVYFSAKQGRITDEVTGVTLYGPDMPGKKLVRDMPYYFDELFSLEMGKDATTGQVFRYLRTNTDIQYEAKDRSGALEPFEAPDLGIIIEKILSSTNS